MVGTNPFPMTFSSAVFGAVVGDSNPDMSPLRTIRMRCVNLTQYKLASYIASGAQTSTSAYYIAVGY